MASVESAGSRVFFFVFFLHNTKRSNVPNRKGAVGPTCGGVVKAKVADMVVESPHWYEYLVSGFKSVTVTWWMYPLV